MRRRRAAGVRRGCELRILRGSRLWACRIIYKGEDPWARGGGRGGGGKGEGNYNNETLSSRAKRGIWSPAHNNYLARGGCCAPWPRSLASLGMTNFSCR